MEMDVSEAELSGDMGNEVIPAEQRQLEQIGQKREHIVPRGLMDLPDVVYWKLLGFLNLNSWKTLRLVCHSTKSWIEETPQQLRKLPIYISDKETRDAVLESSTVPWSNIVLEIHPSDDADSIVPFLQHYSHVMKDLKIVFKVEHCKNSFLDDIVTNLGEGLESLHLVGNLLNHHIAYTNNWIIFKNEEQIIERTEHLNLKNLRHLNLQLGRFNQTTIEVILPVIELFFKNCPRLISLKLPVGFPLSNASNLPKYPGEGDTEMLIDFLKKRAKIVEEEGKTVEKIRIDFCSETKYLESTCNPIFAFLITPSLLVRMAMICKKIGAKLINVPSTALPSLDLALSLSKDEICSLNYAVESILAINYMINYLGNLYRPPHAPIRVIVRIKDQTRLDERVDFIAHYRNPDIPANLNLESLNLHQIMSAELMTVLCDKFMLIPKDTVKELELVVSGQVLSRWLLKAPEIFPSLVKMNLGGTKGKPLTWEWPLGDLAYLEDLTLTNATIEFDNVLSSIGTSTPFIHPFLVSMKRLKHLRLINVLLKSTTDHTFKYLFSKMKPKTFIFRPRKPTCVSFKFGISALASEESEFRTAVETFECCVPRGSTRGDMSAFVRKFPNLRNSRIWDIYEE